MSYTVDVDSRHRVTFRDERAWIVCRLEYIDSGWYDNRSFSSFIELDYRNYHPDDIENIEHIGGPVGIVYAPYIPLQMSGPIAGDPEAEPQIYTIEDSTAAPYPYTEGTSADPNSEFYQQYYNGDITDFQVQGNIHYTNEQVYMMGLDKANGKDKTVITKIEKAPVKKVSRYDLMDMED